MLLAITPIADSQKHFSIDEQNKDKTLRIHAHFHMQTQTLFLLCWQTLFFAYDLQFNTHTTLQWRETISNQFKHIAALLLISKLRLT